MNMQSITSNGDTIEVTYADGTVARYSRTDGTYVPLTAGEIMDISSARQAVRHLITSLPDTAAGVYEEADTLRGYYEMLYRKLSTLLERRLVGRTSTDDLDWI